MNCDNTSPTFHSNSLPSYRLKCIIFLMLVSNQLLATDPQFTQFYAAPLYMNPAFAGAIDCWRAGANYRSQWSFSNQPYTTYSAYIDHNLAATTRFKGGAGLYVFRDSPGAGNYTTYEIAPMLSYFVNINKKTTLRFGLQPSYHLKYGNFGSFTFGDQIDQIRGPIFGTADNGGIPSQLNFFDLSTGFLLFSDNYWVGLSGHHLLKVPFAFENNRAAVPMKFSLHGGYKFYLESAGDYETSISPVINIRSQWANLQMDAGFYYQAKYLTLGLWYRGLPVIGGAGFNTDMVAALVGFKWNQYKVGYSYDLTLSKMAYTYGSHEVSLIYEFCFYANKKQRPPLNVRQLPCP